MLFKMRSPCVNPTSKIHLLDAGGNLLGGAVCRVIDANSEGFELVADDQGVVQIPATASSRSPLVIEWSHPAARDVFVYRAEIALGSFATRDEQLVRLLQNLGYRPADSPAAAVIAFQSDYNIDADPEPLGLIAGAIPEDTAALIMKIGSDPSKAVKATG